MTNQHPITPPPKLVEQWYNAIDNQSTTWKQQLATRAAQWGADQELEACIELIKDHGWFANPVHRMAELRAARRPEPPSLKEEALQKSTSMMINCHWDGPPPSPHASVSDWFEQEGSKGVLYGLRISALPSRGGNRSPKPPSLKEQALLKLKELQALLQFENVDSSCIRRALEALPDD
jgi:hypothetical protein